MCGIAGYYSFQKDFPVPLREMTRCISHRGPDAEGFFTEKNVGLGHRRLSIIDLSSAANQPMTSRDQRWVLAFNGELYNFKEIGRQLPVVLKTQSDAEVMLESFANHGIQTIQKFNGMFAAALYDREENSMFLFRDRLGVKPLFYLQDQHAFYFASEIKSLLCVLNPDEKKNYDENALQLFLQLGFIPEPYTAWKKIKKFPSGCFAKINNREIIWQRYWSAESSVSENTLEDVETAEKELQEKLFSAVELRMISDVPFGIFLSGGIDSSLITAIAQRQYAAPLKTFSIGFKESDFDESRFAREISGLLKTDHHEFLVKEKEAQQHILESLDLFDEPYADSSSLPFMLLSKLARQDVKMALTGDGADELFMGYNRYYISSLLENTIIRNLKLPVSYLLKFGNDKWKRASSIFNDQDENPQAHLLSQAQQFFSGSQVKRLFHREHAAALHYEIAAKRKLSMAEQQALFEIGFYLRDDLLVKADRAGMCVALECRSPFLDYRVVEFALNLNEKLKRKGRNGKLILKKILGEYVPPSVFDRPKRGFGIPLAKWLRGELRFLIDDYFSDAFLSNYTLLDRQMLIELRNCFLKKDASLYHKIWTVIALHRWMKKNL